MNMGSIVIASIYNIKEKSCGCAVSYNVFPLLLFSFLTEKPHFYFYFYIISLFNCPGKFMTLKDVVSKPCLVLTGQWS
jgi:hypothetical protein